MYTFRKLKSLLIIFVSLLIIIYIYGFFNQELRIRKILLYTTCFGDTPWPGMEEEYLNNILIPLQCNIKNCEVTYNKSYISKADAVVFHGKDVNTIELIQLTAKRNENQLWAWFSSETPESTPYKNIEKLKYYTDTVFNLTITYQSNSDIFIPYGKYAKYTSPSSKALVNITGKTKMVAWMVGNCEPYVRRSVAMDLVKKNISIDIAGRCESAYKGLGFGSMGCAHCDDTLKKYKFYFAAENIVCNDYVTEKYWLWPLNNNMVPIVLAANDNTMIPGSYISVDQFRTMNDLAEHLKLLDQNDDLYSKYFEWKKYYYRIETGDSFPYASIFICELCRMTTTEPIQKRTVKMSEVWNRSIECDSNDHHSNYTLKYI